MKICNRCKIEKGKELFYIVKGYLSSICKSCSNEQTREWRSKNRARNAENARKWAMTNPDKIKESNRKASVKFSDINVARARKWALANPDRVRERARDWARSNPEKVNCRTASYKASKRKAIPAWANEFYISEAYDLAKLRERYLGGRWEVDHIVPLRGRTVCGLHVQSNLQVVRKQVNMSKGNRFWPDMP